MRMGLCIGLSALLRPGYYVAQLTRPNALWSASLTQRPSNAAQFQSPRIVAREPRLVMGGNHAEDWQALRLSAVRPASRQFECDLPGAQAAR